MLNEFDEWTVIIPEFPDATDVGKRIEGKKDDNIVTGILKIKEWVFFDKSDEGPIFIIKSDDGKEYSFVEFDEFRFTEQIKD